MAQTLYLWALWNSYCEEKGGYCEEKGGYYEKKGGKLALKVYFITCFLVLYS